MKFIKLTYLDDTEVVLNMAFVVAYESKFNSDTGKFLHTTITLTHTEICVKETTRQISSAP